MRIKNLREAVMKTLFISVIIILISSAASFSQSGRFENITVYSPSLEGNLLGDSTSRGVSVYLPWQYDSIPSARFPVIYMLHGYGWTNTSFVNYFNLESNFNWAFNQSWSVPMIVVIPDNFNFYKGSWYTNSIVTGGWEDFVTQDLIDYIDINYRTLSDRESRGISGWSMGGYGAITLAMKNPDIYSAVYGLSSANLVSEKVVLGTMYNYLVFAACVTDSAQFGGLPWQVQVMIAAGAAFSPNVDPHPFYCDLPVDCPGNLIDTTWQKWLDYDPYSMIDTYKNNLLQYNGNIRFDCGWYDTDQYIANCEFDTALTEKNIGHSFFPYDGDHSNKIQERIRWAVIPFFAETLVDDVESENQNIPNEFMISQNYPNPFNPLTTIKYQVPELSFVTIKVYDVLGDEISTLVNEEKSIGSYEVEFDEVGLPSGVYFYQLKAGSFVETKKMILLK